MRKNLLAHTFLTPGRISALLALLLAASPLYSAVRPAFADVAVGTSAGDFLGFEIGASSAGLAGANTSVASGASSQFWNPSLLATMTRPQASMMHATWLGNLQYEWVGYARPLGAQKGVGSASVAYFHMPSISGVDEFDNPTGDFHVYDMALTLGYARPVMKGLMLGANGKFIRQTLATVSGTGGAVDLGAAATIAGATLGATVQNLGPDLSLGGGKYSLPQVTRFGVSHPFFTERLLLAADYTMPKTYYNDVRVGAEIRPNPILALRVGYRRVAGTSDDPSTGLSFGLGAHYGPMNLDYAMTPDNGFADIHRLSFGYTFGAEGRPEPKAPEPRKQPARPPTTKQPPVIASAPTAKKADAAPESKPPAVAKPSAVPASPAPAVAEAPKSSAPAPAQPKSSGPDQYEVVLGSYETESSAQSELKALRILGFSLKDATITQIPGAGYQLTLARLNSKKSADELAASLVALSFAPRVEIARR
ncbi:MAG TPA: PorV/PorQ family protein [Candidatus Binatia bacterium]|nr:PorV/PorQ family protein [Candidatus Binatia bacterium]